MKDDSNHIPVTYENCDRITGPFYHGTAAVLEAGDLLTPGFASNYQEGRVSNNIYFSATDAQNLLGPSIPGEPCAQWRVQNKRIGRTP